MANLTTHHTGSQQGTKYCKHCGKIIAEAAVICIHCGCQVEALQQTSQPIIIHNNNQNINTNRNSSAMGHSRARNKWVAFFLCLFLGFFGGHKFYEGRVGMGIVYLLTFGLFGFGWLADCFILLCKPNPYFI